MIMSNLERRAIKCGQKFGRLTVIKSYIEKKSSRKWCHLVRCECGKEHLVQGGALTSGHSKSCGCLVRDINTKHGKSGSPEFRIRQDMIQRCTNKNNKRFSDYGGRGILICDRWLESFENFYADMGERLSKDHSIDRIDNNGNYEPNNCQWSDREHQQRNQRAQKRNKTGITGVGISKTGSFEASITVAKRKIYIGRFKTLEEAAGARLNAEHKYFGTNTGSRSTKAEAAKILN